ncbi:ABC transporter ATP-binding protein [Marivirga salinae]|uniref:ABC transporter ATP-binding protein n=1 Tax=Marivirga salinarum TaxID=3059078 RepID=A0AA49GCT3_9BACT|nr:ABC transporter ATP-binding protein [Marivirga sp. BDSF4-3]WKK77156.2 ABC transporter ATP-binding protein [Marivirga sp. BDSF4-3]
MESTTAILSIKDLSLSIGNQHILEDLNFTMNKNSILSVIGENGSGKTSLINILSKTYTNHKGIVRLNEKNILLYPKSVYNQILGSLIGNACVYPHLSIKENLIYVAKLYQLKENRVSEILDIIDLSDEKDKKVKAISMGMKQRLGLGIAFLHKPELILLDEPTNGLDQAGVKDLIALIKKLNQNHEVSFLIASHNFDFLDKLQPEILALKKGKVVFHQTLKASNEPLTINSIYNEYC